MSNFYQLINKDTRQKKDYEDIILITKDLKPIMMQRIQTNKLKEDKKL
jgi:hypothetical protein